MAKPPSSPHFVFRFQRRNQRMGPGHGTSGLRDMKLFRAYRDGLETAYKTFTAPPFLRHEPAVDSAIKKTEVDITGCPHPLTYAVKGVARVELPAVTRMVGRGAELKYARIAGVHELTHVFNHTERPLDEKNSNCPSWEWFDEGTALYMEWRVFPKCLNYLEYDLDHCDQPDRPLDDASDMYGKPYRAATFVRYLVKRWGPELLSEIWMRPVFSETPVETIERLLTARGVHPDEISGLFATFCLNAFFLNDPTSHCHAPDVYSRYGERALEYSHRMTARYKQPIQGRVEHLACHYYRFLFAKKVQEVEFQWVAAPPNTDLRAQVAASNAKKCLGQVVPLPTVGAVKVPVTPRDALILVVSNSARLGDAIPYSIKAHAA